MVTGEPSVMISGMILMPLLHVDNLDSHQKVYTVLHTIS